MNQKNENQNTMGTKRKAVRQSGRSKELETVWIKEMQKNQIMGRRNWDFEREKKEQWRVELIKVVKAGVISWPHDSEPSASSMELKSFALIDQIPAAVKMGQLS